MKNRIRYIAYMLTATCIKNNKYRKSCEMKSVIQVILSTTIRTNFASKNAVWFEDDAYHKILQKFAKSENLIFRVKKE